MHNPKRMALSPFLIVLDILGALLVARGAWLAANDAGGLWYVVAGLLLMVPLGARIVNLKTRREKSDSEGGRRS